MHYCIFSDTYSPLMNIESIGYSKNPKITRFGPGQRDRYIIHYIISGNGYYNGNKVSKGQGFIITPNLLEHYYPDEKEPWEYLWFISPDEKFKEILPQFCADKNTLIFSHNAYRAINDVVEVLKNKNRTVVNSYEMLELFLKIFNSHIKNVNSPEEKSNADIYLDFAVNYINSNISSVITVSELTEILGISQAYLFKLFDKKFGVSTKQYILDVKLSKAKQLLTQTNLTVTHISASVGFSDVLSFSKFFSKNTGLSPLKFRFLYQNNIKN